MPTQKTRYRPHLIQFYSGQTIIREAIHEVLITEYSKRDKDGNFSTYNPCTHKKVVSPGAIRISEDREETDWSYMEFLPFDDIVAFGLSKAHISLDFQENNQFELIPFLMDWDSTIATFTLDFIKKFSYGAATWGVMPLVSDIKSLCGTLKDIQGGMLESYNKILGKPITRRFSWETEISDPFYFKHLIKGTTVIKGVLSGPQMYPDDPFEAGLAFLDEIGLNLDLKTVWDIIPLSFVFDYFLPIGDFLETLHPRGWFSPEFQFLGTYSVKADVVQYPIVRTKGSACIYSVYSRQSGQLNLSSRPTVEPKYETPSLRELFNVAYLAALNGRF